MQDDYKPSCNEIEIKVVTSYHCDINCRYCYNKYINKYYQPNYSMVVNSLSRILQKNNLNAIIEIIGGDPLSSQNYVETKNIIDYLVSLKRDKRNIKIVLQTGSCEIEKINQIIPKIDGLSYSIDISSSPKISNIRNLEEIVKYCKNQDVAIQIQTALSPIDKIEIIYQFINLCNSYGVGWIGLDYPRYQLYTNKELDMQANIYVELIKHMKEFGNIVVAGAVIESVTDFLSGYKYSSCCMCGEKSITIQPDGSLSPSFHFHSNDFNSLDTFNEIKFKRQKKLRESYCSGCKIWDVCLGGCMDHAKFLTGDIYSHDKEYCYLLSEVVERL